MYTNTIIVNYNNLLQYNCRFPIILTIPISLIIIIILAIMIIYQLITTSISVVSNIIIIQYSCIVLSLGSNPNKYEKYNKWNIVGNNHR